MRLLFVTGSSGAGKSTLVTELRSMLPEYFETHDFDELGVPLDADKAWRIETTKKWVTRAEENDAQGISTIIVGLTHPNEVHDIATERHIEVAFCMLEVEPEELRRRLMAHRFSSPERIENLKKYEGVTPEEFFENNRIHTEQIRQEALRLNAFFLDTTHLSPHEAATEVMDWILSGK